MTKNFILDNFTSAAFVHLVWDPGNKKASALLERLKNRIDPITRKKILDQIKDTDLRNRWITARLSGSTLPRVFASVARHFQNEYQKAFPTMKGKTYDPKNQQAPQEI